MSDHVLEVQPATASQAPALLCPDPLIVRLNKAFSWQQSSSHWPFYLSRAEPERVYSRKEIIETIFRSDRAKHEIWDILWLRSIYGLYLDPRHQEIIIEGIGLFERVDESNEAFRITDDGVSLAQSYSTDPSNDEWKRAFANILAKNDVRVRCVLLHLARWQWLLTFRKAGLPTATFFSNSTGSCLRALDGTEQLLFEVQKGRTPTNTFTLLLQRDPYITLGPFLRKHIEHAGLRVPEQIHFESGRYSPHPSKEPSINDLPLYLKQALSLFRDIGVLVYLPHRQGWTLDHERCAEALEPAVVADLFGGAPESRFLDALRLSVGKLSDAEGLARIADLRDYLCDELDIPPGERVEYFNRQVAYYVRPDVGKLSIGRTFHAVAPPDDCLFGDLTQEYVEFLFAPA